MATAPRRALYGKLAGDGTLNALLGTPASGYSKAIYHNAAPQGAAFPLVIFNKQSGVPTQAMRDPSAFETDIWLIKGVARGDTADPAEAIATRLNDLLNDGTLSISGATQLWLRRESDVEYMELADGVRYHHVGALFRLSYQ